MKRNKFLWIVAAVLLLGLTLSVWADEVPGELTIQSTEEFLQFAENCRLDSFSRDLTVRLTADIDLTGHNFSGIPVFCGTFEGNGHTVSGVKLDFSGSYAGLFRYVTASARIVDLNLQGEFSPTGSGSYAGSIAGSNSGSIQNCTFSGSVSGIDHIGGIAGINTETGIIENCTANGSLYGNHFTGGIAGSNSGIIKNCINYSSVNIQLQQNNVDLSDITLDALTGSESAATVTDIGGIAGISSGYISQCQNSGNIGYPHIGYNIGGIAGSQTGYIGDCINTGIISGRKEIGGIVGQLEPVVAITYTVDTLQILQQQLNDLSSIVDSTADRIGSTFSGVNTQFILISGEIREAMDGLTSLLPQEGEAPGIEDLSAAVEILQNTAQSVSGGLQNIYQDLQSAQSGLTRDVEQISYALSAMQQTLNNASDHLGGSVSDHSDADTEADLTAKVAYCQNSGMISADLNGGGIVGAIAFESDLDPEVDLDIFGDTSLNFAGSYRAVVTQCENTASIAVKKQYAGGIVGYATLGLIRDCRSIGELICPNAVYVGGIAGRSNGSIRSCAAKAVISAQKLAGGIAGQAKKVSECLVLSSVSADERSGSVLGYAEDLAEISNNSYMQISPDLGAVDGISYAAAAQGIAADEFLNIPDLPEFFKTYAVTFVFADGSSQTVRLNTGEALTSQQIPELPVIDGCKGTWNGLAAVTYFDTTVSCTYESKVQTVESQVLRPSGLPVLLAEGEFHPEFSFEITALSDSLAPDAIEGWSFIGEGVASVRYLPPEGTSADTLCVMVKDGNGGWKQIPHTVIGSYLVFQTGSQIDAFCVVPTQSTPWGLYIAAGAVFLAIAAVSAFIIIRRKKARRQPSKAPAES